MTNEKTTTRKLRPVEVGAGAGAAVITAFASSYLGTAGTLTGAAVASVVGTVSTSLLRTSAETSAARLRQTTARLKPPRTGHDDIDPYGTQLLSRHDWIDPETDPTTSLDPTASGVPTDIPTGPTSLFPPGPSTMASASGPADRKRAAGAAGGVLGRVRPRWVVLGASALAAFALALVAITGIESAAGKPLAGLVGRESGGGTTLGRATGGDTGSGGDRPATPSGTPGGSTGPSATSSGTSPEPGAPTPSPSGGGSPTTVPTPTGQGGTPAPPPPPTQPTQAPSPLTSP